MLYSIHDLIRAEQSVIACFHAQPTPALRMAASIVSTLVGHAKELANAGTETSDWRDMKRADALQAIGELIGAADKRARQLTGHVA